MLSATRLVAVSITVISSPALLATYTRTVPAISGSASNARRCLMVKPRYRIAVLPGDGIGPEVIAEAVKVLRAVEKRLDGVSFELEEFSVGAGEYLRSGDPMPPATFERCKDSDAILLGAMG